MALNPEDESSYSTQHQEAFLKFVQNKYSAKYQQLSIINTEKVPHSDDVHFTMESEWDQLLFEQYHSSCNDEEYFIPKCVAEMTSGWSDHAPCSFAATPLYSNSLPELQ